MHVGAVAENGKVTAVKAHSGFQKEKKDVDSRSRPGFKDGYCVDASRPVFAFRPVLLTMVRTEGLACTTLGLTLSSWGGCYCGSSVEHGQGLYSTLLTIIPIDEDMENSTSDSDNAMFLRHAGMHNRH